LYLSNFLNLEDSYALNIVNFYIKYFFFAQKTFTILKLKDSRATEFNVNWFSGWYNIFLESFDSFIFNENDLLVFSSRMGQYNKLRFVFKSYYRNFILTNGLLRLFRSTNTHNKYLYDLTSFIGLNKESRKIFIRADYLTSQTQQLYTYNCFLES
jgi:hypothetical protein